MKTLNSLFDLTNKVALINGGAGYLGSAISESLGELGATIVIASRDYNECEKKVIELENKGLKAFPLEIDITNVDSIKKAIEIVINNFGKIDILVNAAWSGKKNTWESIGFNDWENDVDICLNGPFKVIKITYEYLKVTKGVILNIGSMYGHIAPDYRLYENVPQSNPPSYGAAKAGIIQLTKYLASFLSVYEIRVNCISPGAFPFPEVVATYPEFIKRLNSKNPLKRIGKPEELKGIVGLLCSNAGSYINGQNICVDGGWGIW